MAGPGTVQAAVAFLSPGIYLFNLTRPRVNSTVQGSGARPALSKLQSNYKSSLKCGFDFLKILSLKVCSAVFGTLFRYSMFHI